MSKYLKKFETEAQYTAAESSLILPNVSLVTENNTLHYNPYVPPETRIVGKFNVTDTSSATIIMSDMWYAQSYFDSIEIDGVEQELVVPDYIFDTTGEHTVKYTLKDSTSIDMYAFYECYKLTTITIPNSVTSIGDGVFQYCSGLTSVTIGSGVTRIGSDAFYGCSSLTSINIPDSVTSIGDHAFCDCSSLTSITVEATTPPTLGFGTFDNTGNCSIYVPSGSVNAYQSATNWSDYASRIQAIP